jgi:hypothetical protein
MKKEFLILAVLSITITVFQFGICVKAFAQEKNGDISFTTEGIAITIEKRQVGANTHVDVRSTSTTPVETGAIGDLVLKYTDSAGTVREGKILSITNDTIIKTVSSPGCTWVFHSGQWWRVCN